MADRAHVIQCILGEVSHSRETSPIEPQQADAEKTVQVQDLRHDQKPRIW